MLKNSKNWAPQNSRQIRWRTTLRIQWRLEMGAVVFSGFFVKPTGPPHLFYTAGSTGCKIEMSGPKKSFSTESAEGGHLSRV
jgi:hypothetical protein